MKTSYYFSNRIREPGMNLIAVSNSYPKQLSWLKDARQYKKLFPGWSLVKDFKQHKISWQNYVEIYQEDILCKLNPEEVYSSLGEDAIILCWRSRASSATGDLLQTGFMIICKSKLMNCKTNNRR